MKSVKKIVSADNPHFKTLKRYCQNGRERRRAGLIVLDGMHLIESYAASQAGIRVGSRSDVRLQALQTGGWLREVVIAESAQHKPELARYLDALPVGVAVTLLAERLFNALAPVQSPTGILALAVQPACPVNPDMAGDAVLLDGIQDPGNVGSILRSAAAAGFGQALLTVECAQAWSPKVLRAAMGAHFLLAIHEDADLCAFIDGYRGLTLATTLNAVSRPLFGSPDGPGAPDLARPGQALAWVFGSEGQGIRPVVASRVACRVRIPMPGAAESLNVAAAAAICLFETVRQRISKSTAAWSVDYCIN